MGRILFNMVLRRDFMLNTFRVDCGFSDSCNLEAFAYQQSNNFWSFFRNVKPRAKDRSFFEKYLSIAAFDEINNQDDEKYL